MSRQDSQVIPFPDIARAENAQNRAAASERDPSQHVENASERRRFNRASVDITASVIDSKRRIIVQVVEISIHGAMLRMDKVSPLGKQLDLVIPAFGRFAAELIWQRGNIVGLRFLDEPYKVGWKLPGRLRAELLAA